jgi:hypothetical protein
VISFLLGCTGSQACSSCTQYKFWSNKCKWPPHWSMAGPSFNMSMRWFISSSRVSHHTLYQLWKSGQKTGVNIVFMEGMNSNMIYLIHCKNHCNCYNVPPPSITIIKINKIKLKIVFKWGFKIWNTFITVREKLQRQLLLAPPSLTLSWYVCQN